MSIIITSAAQLQAINDDVTADYILGGNIDLTGVEWTPIGLDSPFIGTFDGQNYTISNLTITTLSNNSGGVGLFGSVGDNTNIGKIKNLNMDTVVINGSGSLGAIVGMANGLQISNCKVSNITLNCSGDNMLYVGNCGGMLGEIYGYAAAITTITNCTSENIAINVSGNAWDYFGGLIGFALIDTDYPQIVVSSCSVNGFSFSNGTDGTGEYSGGFAGYLSGTVDECYATNVVIVGRDEDYGHGGFIGEGDGRFSNIYVSGIISGSLEAAGGLFGEFNVSPIAGLSGYIFNCYANVTISVVGSGLNGEDGGFIGSALVSNTNSWYIRNCYSVGVVSESEATLTPIGGFIGELWLDTYSLIIENCSWFTGANTLAIGNTHTNISDTSYATLSELGYGTDEAANTALYSKSHTVYAQGGTDPWDFTSPVWYEHSTKYPDFFPDPETGGTVITALSHGFNNGDYVKIDIVKGTEELNMKAFVVASANENTFEIRNLDGSVIDATGYGKYISGGQVRLMNTVYTGLWHLEGETVTVQADGGLPSAQQTFLVQGGTITLRDRAAVVHIGLPYEGLLQFLPIGGTMQTGTTQTKNQKLYLATLRVFQSLGGYFGMDEDHLFKIVFPTEIPNAKINMSKLPYTGDYEVDFESSYEKNVMPVLKIIEPLPFMLLAAVFRSDIEEGK